MDRLLQTWLGMEELTEHTLTDSTKRRAGVSWGPEWSRARCEVCLAFVWPLPHLTLPRAPAVMGSLALAGVRMAVGSVEAMVLPVVLFRETSPTEGGPWAIRRSCGSRQAPPICRLPSSDPVPITSVRNWTSVPSPSPSCFFDVPSTPSSAQQKAKQEEAVAFSQACGEGGEGGRLRSLASGHAIASGDSAR